MHTVFPVDVVVSAAFGRPISISYISCTLFMSKQNFSHDNPSSTRFSVARVDMMKANEGGWSVCMEIFINFSVNRFPPYPGKKQHTWLSLTWKIQQIFQSLSHHLPTSSLNVSEFIIPFKHFYFSQCHIVGLNSTRWLVAVVWRETRQALKRGERKMNRRTRRTKLLSRWTGGNQEKHFRSFVSTGKFSLFPHNVRRQTMVRILLWRYETEAEESRAEVDIVSSCVQSKQTVFVTSMILPPPLRVRSNCVQSRPRKS